MNKQATHPCGVIFLDKPKGWSSRKAVNEVIRVFSKPGQKNRKQRPKAGHAGTLDPLATGMLPILIGDATRFTSMGLNADKSYDVSFDLSFQTDTLDLEGEVLERFAEISVSSEQLQACLNKFIGKQLQTPPAYSAIKVDGKRAYDLARTGQDVALQAREIEIQDIRLLSYTGSVVTLSVDCTKGTYIRSLARDIGERLGVGGCVTMLRRTSSGGWPAAMMVSIDELQAGKETCIVPLRTWLRDLPEVQLSEQEGKRFVQGQRVAQACDVADQTLCIILSQNLVLGTAVYDARLTVLQPQRVLPSAQERLK